MSGILDQLQKTNNNTTQKRTFVGIETKEEKSFIKNEEEKHIGVDDNTSTKSIISNDVKSILDRIRNRMKKSNNEEGFNNRAGVDRFGDIPFFTRKNTDDNEANAISNNNRPKIDIDDFIKEKIKKRIESSEFGGVDGNNIPIVGGNVNEDGIVKLKKKKIKKKKVDDNDVENKEKINISSLSTGEIIKLVREGKLKHSEVLSYIKNKDKPRDIKPISLEHKENINFSDDLYKKTTNDENEPVKDKTSINNLSPSEVLKLVKEGKLKHSEVMEYIKNNNKIQDVKPINLSNKESKTYNNDVIDKKIKSQNTSSAVHTTNTSISNAGKIDISNLPPNKILQLVKEGKITHGEAINYIKNNKPVIVNDGSNIIQQKKDSDSELSKKDEDLQNNGSKKTNDDNISVGDVLKMVREGKMTHGEAMNYVRNKKANTIDNETIQNTEHDKETKIIKNDIIDEDIREIVNRRLTQKQVVNDGDEINNNLTINEEKIINKGQLQDYSVVKKKIQKSIIADDDFLIRPKIKNVEENIIKQQIDNSFVENDDLFLVKHDNIKDTKTQQSNIKSIDEVIKEEETKEQQNIIEEDIAPINDELQIEKTEEIPLSFEDNKSDNSVMSKNKESSDFLQSLMNVEEKELPQNVDNTEEKKEEVECIYSSVIDFTSSVPIESFDGDGYEKIRADKCVFLDSHITENDLIELYKNNKDIESLDISNCDNLVDFSIISKFENLKELNVNNCDNFDNIECLQGCKNLRVLNIGNTKVRNIDNIGIFPELRIFNCSCNSITNIKNIHKCEKLVELNLWGCVSVGDLNGLENLYNLRSLDVDSTSITDLFPLVNCKNIEFLFMDNCTKLTDLYSLSSLSNLKCLLADSKNMLTDSQLEVFEDLVNLEYITLNSRRIHSLYSFRKLTKMKELNLQGCNVTDLSPIENLTELTKLDVTANSALKDLSPLFKMTKLKKLIAGGGGVAAGKVGNLKGAASSTMAIEDISVVKNFTKLKEINLNSNIRLKDISAMSVCEKMEEVYLQKCTQLEDVSVLGNLKNIVKINISSCPRIKELYFLRNLPNLLELLYDGTIVHTPGLTTILKKANGIYLLKGNDADILSQAMLGSGKKKAKLMKAFKSYFPSKEKEDKK